jgi:hypothetical protein
MRHHVLVVAVLGACADPVEFSGPPELTLGVGVDVFMPVTDGDPVPIETGTQGGTAVFGGVAARNLDPHEVELVFTIAPPDGPPSLRRFIANLDETGVTLGLPMFLLDEREFAGLPCTWRVEARDRDGRTAVDEKTVIPTRSAP